MNLIDIISLAKAGYKKSDIDELLSVPVDEPEPIEAIQNSTEIENDSKGEPLPSPEISENVPDYEKLYNEIMKELETVKNDLKIAQENNRRENHGPDHETDPYSDLAEIVRGYM